MTTSDRPNILFICTDQQSADAMSCAGHPDVSTPVLDALAAQGVRFTQTYCTYPLCTPARASMFSGRYPHEVGIVGNNVPIDGAYAHEELGHLLSAAGYECVYGGKWHVPEIAMPEGHGFRTICGFDDVALPYVVGDYLRASQREAHARPFFLVASFDNPHNICEWRRQQNVPWGPVGTAAAERQRRPNAPPRMEECPSLPANYPIPPFEPEAIRIISEANPRIYPDERYTAEQWRRYRWGYYRLVEKVDAQIGQILNVLEETGLADNTVVLFSSDHGDAAGSHHLAQKSFLYQEQTNVPFIVRAPGGAAGRVDHAHLVSNGPDLYATICDAAGVELPEGIVGKSVLPLMAPTAGSAEEVPWTDHVVAETHWAGHNCDGRMVRTARYKYVAYTWGAYREALYDLQTDPGEMVNLAVRSTYDGVLQQHRDLLRAWCERTNDTFYGHHYSHPDLPYIVPGDLYPQSY